MSGLLDNLPSSGTCTAARPGSHGGLAPYVAAHDTAPPAEQVIGTDSTNLLIRTLTLKKEREERARKEAEGAGKGKRKEAEGGGAGGAGGGAGGSGAPAAKRAAPDEGGEGGGVTTRAAARGFDVKQLKAALQKRGLPVSGNKARSVRVRRCVLPRLRCCVLCPRASPARCGVCATCRLLCARATVARRAPPDARAPRRARFPPLPVSGRLVRAPAQVAACGRRRQVSAPRAHALLRARARARRCALRAALRRRWRQRHRQRQRKP
jgi:hypothetical protein